MGCPWDRDEWVYSQKLFVLTAESTVGLFHVNVKNTRPWRMLGMEWGGLIEQHTKPGHLRDPNPKPQTARTSSKVPDLL